MAELSVMSYERESLLYLTVDSTRLSYRSVPSPAVVELAASKRFEFNLLTWEDSVRDAFLEKYSITLQ